MIITLAGNVASGKSTVGKALAEKLKIKHHSSGDFMRKIAKEEGITLHELGEKAEKSIQIDRMIDEMTIKLSKKKDNFLMDSRLAWYFIPNSVKIYLYAGKREQIRRIGKDLKDNKRGEENIKHAKEILKSVEKRENSERTRYMKYYGIDYHQKHFYDFWQNTNGKTVTQCVNEIVAFLKKKGHLKK
jgi:CMP/dCMP kinase